MKRRHFFKQSLAGFLGLATAKAATLTEEFSAQKPEISKKDLADPSNEQAWLRYVVRHFPVSRNESSIYLNTGGLGACPDYVLEQTFLEMKRISGAAVRLSHGKIVEHPSDRREEIFPITRKRIASFMGISSSAEGPVKEVALVRNTTEGINIICQGLMASSSNAARPVITTTHEHVGNVFPWFLGQYRQRFKLVPIELSKDSSTLNMKTPEELIQEIKEKLEQYKEQDPILSISHVTSSGYLFPVKEIGQLVESYRGRYGAFYFIDGAQALGMIPLKLNEYHCDAYVASGHKWLCGPIGTGVLYVNQKHLGPDTAKEQLSLNDVGVTSTGAYSAYLPNPARYGSDFEQGELAFSASAERYEYGTPSSPLFQGLHAALEFQEAIGTEHVQARILFLAQTFVNGLKELNTQWPNRIHIQSYQREVTNIKTGLVTFKIQGLPYGDLYNTFKARQIRIRFVSEGGLSAIRASFHIFNTQKEIRTFLRILAEAMAKK